MNDSSRIQLHAVHATARAQLASHLLAESTSAIRLEETGYPPRLYFPMADIDERWLVASATTTHCPYKGDTRYYHVRLDGQQWDDVAWCYPSPIPSMQAIAGHLAFDHAELIVSTD